MKKDDNSRLVYSTETGRIKHPKEKPATTPAHKDPRDGVIRIHHQTKGRGGKGVCIITGLPGRHDELAELAKKLKQHCGSGGTVKHDVIEIQGDHRNKLKTVLENMGHTVKLAGG